MVKKQSHKPKRWLARSLISSGLLSLFVLTSMSVGVVYVLHVKSKSTEKVVLDLAKTPIKQHITIVDSLDRPMTANADKSYYIPSKLSGSNKNVSDLYVKTLVAIEDKSFFTRRTRGYDLKGIAGATASHLKAKLLGSGTTKGGSTIDQQLVKTLMLGGASADDSINRKIIEVLESHDMAKTYSRNQILTAYIDSIRLTPDTIGVSAAWQVLFDGKFNQSDNENPEFVSKIAYMAGLGQMPSTYIYQFDKAGKNRALTVLHVMYQESLISKEVYKKAKAYTTNKLSLKPQQTNAIDVSYQPYLAMVHSELQNLNLPTYADIKIKTWANLDQLKELNNIANFKSSPVTNAPAQTLPEGTLTAISAVDTKTGHILGIATNADNPLTPLTSERSSGSSIKPIIDYAPAVEFAGLTSNSILNGNTTTYSDGVPLANYGLYNYGPITAKFGVNLSINTAAYQAFMMTTTAQKNAIMRPLGLAKDTYTESESIGLNMSTLQQASAYQAIGNDGVHIEATTLDTITVDGKPWVLPAQIKERAMSSRTSAEIIDMMQGVTAANGSEPFAAQPQWPNAFAAKSGLVGFDSTKTSEITAAHGNIMPASDAWMAATSTGVSVATWLGTPDLSGNTFIVGGGAQEANNGRVYLFNNTLHLLNPATLPQFSYSGEVLKSTISEQTLPNVLKVNANLTKDAKTFNATPPSVDANLQKFYDANKSKPIIDANTVFDNASN